MGFHLRPHCCDGRIDQGWQRSWQQVWRILARLNPGEVEQVTE